MAYNEGHEVGILRIILWLFPHNLKIIQEDLKAEILIDMEIKEESRFQRLQ
jgi:hypothetical protein